MTYSVYISNHCEKCEQVLNYLKEHNIQHNVKNIDTDKTNSSVNVFVVPALFLNEKLIAYGHDIVNYFEKHGYNKMSDNDMLKSYPCPVCSQDQPDKLYNVKGFDIVKCSACTMVYVNPRFKDEVIFDIYKKDYFLKKNYTFDDFGYGNYDLTAHLRDKTFSKWYDIIEPHLLLKSGNALEVGCATGRFLQILSNKGWKVKGIELDKGMQEKLIKQGFEVADTPMENYTADEKFMLITIFDVIEHLPHLEKDFKKLYEILDDNGSIAIVTPNFDSFQRKIFGKRWFQFKPREHISYFSPSTFAKAIAPFGFKIVHTSSSAQYADFGFIDHRLKRYGFKKLLSMFNLFTRVTGLKNKTWYIDTGSMLIVLQKSIK